MNSPTPHAVPADRHPRRILPARSAADAIEKRDIGAGVDEMGDPLVAGAVLARDR